jgi:hypothetical protein
LSAAYEVMQNTTKQLTAAQTAATNNGYTGSALAAGCSGTSYLCTSYSYGPVTNGIAVVLQQHQNGWFSNFAELAGATIVNRAIALVGTLGPACIDATSKTAPKAINVVGSSVINTPNCILWATSNASNAIYVQGGNNADIIAQSMVTAGQLSTTGSPVMTLSDPAQFGVSQSLLVNPYAPNGSGTCTGTPCLTHSFLTQGMPACIPDPGLKGGTTSYNAPPYCFNGLTLGPGGGGTTVNLSPGTYWIADGNLTLNSNATLACPTCNGTSGVTIIFTTTKGAAGTIGGITMAANATMGNINAPNSGTFKGLLFVQDTVSGATYPLMQNNATATLQGGPNINFVGTGLIYFPNANLSFQGNPTLGTNGCLILYANTISLQGNSTMAASGCTAAGLGSVPTVTTINLVG